MNSDSLSAFHIILGILLLVGVGFLLEQENYLMAVIIGGGASFFLYFFFMRSRKFKEACVGTANELDMDLEKGTSTLEPDYKLEGTYRDYPVICNLNNLSSKKERGSSIEISLQTTLVADLRITVKRKGLPSQIKDLLTGAPETKIGHKQFDDSVKVKGKSDEEIRAFLDTAPLREALITFFKNYPRSIITDSKILMVRRRPNSKEEILDSIKALRKLAGLLDERNRELNRDESSTQ